MDKPTFHTIVSYRNYQTYGIVTEVTTTQFTVRWEDASRAYPKEAWNNPRYHGDFVIPVNTDEVDWRNKTGMTWIRDWERTQRMLRSEFFLNSGSVATINFDWGVPT